MLSSEGKPGKSLCRLHSIPRGEKPQQVSRSVPMVKHRKIGEMYSLNRNNLQIWGEALANRIILLNWAIYLVKHTIGCRLLNSFGYNHQSLFRLPRLTLDFWTAAGSWVRTLCCQAQALSKLPKNLPACCQMKAGKQDEKKEPEAWKKKDGLFRNLKSQLDGSGISVFTKKQSALWNCQKWRWELEDLSKKR